MDVNLLNVFWWGALWWDCLHIESNWPESLQSTVWTPQSSREQLHSWILQIIGTQVQLSQTRGGGAENWGQSFTASLWQMTAIQPAHKINNVRNWDEMY